MRRFSSRSEAPPRAASRPDDPGPQAFGAVLQERLPNGTARFALLTSLRAPGGATLTPGTVIAVEDGAEPQKEPGPRGRKNPISLAAVLSDLAPGDGAVFERATVRLGAEGPVVSVGRSYRGPKGPSPDIREALACLLPEETRPASDTTGDRIPTGRQHLLVVRPEAARRLTDPAAVSAAIAQVLSTTPDGTPMLVFRAAALPGTDEDRRAIAEASAPGVRAAFHISFPDVQDGDTWRRPTTEEALARLSERLERDPAARAILEAIGADDALVEAIPGERLRLSQFEAPSVSGSPYDMAAIHYAILRPGADGPERLGGTEGLGFQRTIFVCDRGDSGAFARKVLPAERYGVPVPLADVPTAHLPEEHRQGIAAAERAQAVLRKEAARRAMAALAPEPALEAAAAAP